MPSNETVAARLELERVISLAETAEIAGVSERRFRRHYPKSFAV